MLEPSFQNHYSSNKFCCENKTSCLACFWFVTLSEPQLSPGRPLTPGLITWMSTGPWRLSTAPLREQPGSEGSTLDNTARAVSRPFGLGWPKWGPDLPEWMTTEHFFTLPKPAEITHYRTTWLKHNIDTLYYNSSMRLELKLLVKVVKVVDEVKHKWELYNISFILS